MTASDDAKILESSQAAQRTKKAVFPQRASWLRVRLRERSWDHNVPRRFGGPDRKTVLKILDGFAVNEETLDKLTNALNKNKKNAKHIDLLDIPND